MWSRRNASDLQLQDDLAPNLGGVDDVDADVSAPGDVDQLLHTDGVEQRRLADDYPGRCAGDVARAAGRGHRRSAAAEPL